MSGEFQMRGRIHTIGKITHITIEATVKPSRQPQLNTSKQPDSLNGTQKQLRQINGKPSNAEQLLHNYAQCPEPNCLKHHRNGRHNSTE